MYDNPTIQEFKDYFYRDFPYSTDPDAGVLDQDIGKAFGQTNININPGLFADQQSYTIGYLLLAAHWLVYDLRMASGVSGGPLTWATQSKSVGSVAESFAIPQRILDNPELMALTSTMYGGKYIVLILPLLSGAMFITYGSTRP